MTTLTTLIPRRSRRAEGVPAAPVTSVASGGPTTQADDTIARVRMIRAGGAPSWRSCANSSVDPTPGGPPSTTRAITATGSAVVTARTTTRPTR